MTVAPEEPPARAHTGTLDQLARMPLDEAGNAPLPALRLFSTWEICRYLIPMAPAHLRRVLRDHPELPQGRDAGADNPSARWFSMEEVQALRRFFADHGAPGRHYLPFRPQGPRARVIALAQAGRGMGRSVSCHHLAVSAAMEGYRVLVIDLDPAADLTRHLLGQPMEETGTVLPMITRHAAAQLRQENHRRVDNGDMPLPMDAAMDRAVDLAAGDAITASRWPGLDVIGAGPALHRMAWQGTLWQKQIRSWSAWSALRDQMAREGLLSRYDLVLLDTAPDFGLLTVAAVAAADLVLVPLTADPAGAGAAKATLGHMHEVFETIENRETLTARSLGRQETAFGWDAVRFVLTRYDEASQSRAAARLQSALGEALIPQRQHFSPLIGEGRGQVPCIFEADYRDTNRETFVNERASFDAVYAAIKAWFTGAWLAEAKEGPGS